MDEIIEPLTLKMIDDFLDANRNFEEPVTKHINDYELNKIKKLLNNN